MLGQRVGSNSFCCTTWKANAPLDRSDQVGPVLPFIKRRKPARPRTTPRLPFSWQAATAGILTDCLEVLTAGQERSAVAGPAPLIGRAGQEEPAWGVPSWSRQARSGMESPAVCIVLYALCFPLLPNLGYTIVAAWAAAGAACWYCCCFCCWHPHASRDGRRRRWLDRVYAGADTQSAYSMQCTIHTVHVCMYVCMFVCMYIHGNKHQGLAALPCVATPRRSSHSTP